MRITVKLIGPLVDRLPAGGPFSEDPRGINAFSVADNATMRNLLEQLGLAAELEYFAMINELHVPSDTLAERALEEGDDVVLLPPLKGG
jgi:sulfur carrier protein ThiS